MSIRSIAVIFVFVPLVGACRGLGSSPEPVPAAPLPQVDRPVEEQLGEAARILNRMNRVQARADRLEPGTIGRTRLTDFGVLRREEGVRLMMRDLGRAAEGTAWAAGRLQTLLRDPQMSGDPEMRAHLDRISEHLDGMATLLEAGLTDLEEMRARLHRR